MPRASAASAEEHRKIVPRYKQIIPRQWLRIAAAVLVTATTVGSFLPGAMKAQLGTHPTDHLDPWHRFYHFSTFGLTSSAMLLLATKLRDELRAVVFMAGLAFFIEATQYYTGMSEVFEWWDLRDDLFAILTVFLIVQIANRWERALRDYT